MSGIYVDEHGKYQIDLTKTIWSTDKLHDIYTATIGNELSDVDWIGETENEIFLVECKDPTFVEDDTMCRCNGCDCDACKSETNICTKCGKPATRKAVKKDYYAEFLDKCCKKYYGSTFYLLSNEKKKPIMYYCIVNDTPLADRAWRARAAASIKKRLPYLLQDGTHTTMQLIKDCGVVTVDEWNELYTAFPVIALPRQ